VVITIKDHDNILVDRLAARQPCPLCGKPLKFHRVETFAQREAVDERDARMSVNRQMYLLENPEGFVPGNVLFDDRLPPTPSGWFAPRAELSPRTLSTPRAGLVIQAATGWKPTGSDPDPGKWTCARCVPRSTARGWLGIIIGRSLTPITSRTTGRPSA
jgi:hypothetical protein